MLPILIELMQKTKVTWKIPDEFKFRVPSAEEMQRLLTESREKNEYFNDYYFTAWTDPNAVFTQAQVDAAAERFKNANKSDRNSLAGSMPSKLDIVETYPKEMVVVDNVSAKRKAALSRVHDMLFRNKLGEPTFGEVMAHARAHPELTDEEVIKEMKQEMKDRNK